MVSDRNFSRNLLRNLSRKLSRKQGLVWLLGLIISTTVCAQTTQSAVTPVTVKTPADPVQLETLRTYFDEIHYGSWLRRTWAAGYAEQKKQLPAWYPQAVWDEIVKAELGMDLAAVALPVYQKYMSEQAGRYAIKLFATDDGQKLAAKMFAAQDKARATGASANDAYEQALDGEIANENITVRQMLATVTPEDRRKMGEFMHSQEWMQVAGNAVEISRELSDAELAQQKTIMHEQTERHRDELLAARKAYSAGNGASAPPQ
jgi:hypothetical protein